MAITSTTIDVSEAIKTALRNYQGTSLNNIKQYQIGYFGSKAQFPIIAIVPLEEKVSRRFSNGYYNIKRTFRLEAYDRRIKTDEAFDNTVEWVDAMREITENNHTWDDTGFYSEYISDQYGIQQQYGKSILQMSAFELDVITRNQMPDRLVPQTIKNNVKPNDLAERIKTVLRDSSNQSTYDYAKYGLTFHDKPMKPTASPHYPAVLIRLPNKRRSFNKPRSGSPVIPMDLHIISNLIPTEKNMRMNLAIVQKILDVLEHDYSLSNGNTEGYAEDLLLSRIQYQTDREKQLFVSTIECDIYLREYIDTNESVSPYSWKGGFLVLDDDATEYQVSRDVTEGDGETATVLREILNE